MASEEVLLIVNKVRHKKSDGALYLMNERMAWMMDSKKTFTLSFLYADIKVQKISPDTKDKVQLQIVMHDGSACTFHFNNPTGRSAQQGDRESVKELLQQLLPKHRKKMNSELEEKNRRLQEDPELFQLYKDLVVSQVITADEFWANRANKETTSNAKVQDVGVSAAFLSDVKPQSDGCNGLKYNLTADIIESIFRTYPAVKEKHKQNVPGKLSESEFWTKFFQSHYFHRDRINLANNDVFGECAKQDEQDTLKAVEKPSNDVLLDLTKLSDKSQDEGYGTGEDGGAQSNPVNLSMIRRFNHHSSMVLKACNAEHTATSTDNDTSQTPSKKLKLKEKVEYKDLKEDVSRSEASLNLSKMECYLHGPIPLQASTYTTTEEMILCSTNARVQISEWKPNLTQVLSNKDAVSILSDLSPGGSLMQVTNQQQLLDMVPSDVQNEIRQLYNALCELLRHFWCCFPTTTKALEEKAIQMRTNLERFQLTKLNPFKSRVANHHYSINLTLHLEEMLNAAFTRFNAWQAKKQGKKS